MCLTVFTGLIWGPVCPSPNSAPWGAHRTHARHTCTASAIITLTKFLLWHWTYLWPTLSSHYLTLGLSIATPLQPLLDPGPIYSHPLQPLGLSIATLLPTSKTYPSPCLKVTSNLTCGWHLKQWKCQQLMRPCMWADLSWHSHPRQVHNQIDDT